ncbi:MAG: hypothetical protein O7C75_10175 [Verrucomicrobia bacterium]|nr:hypothetical protein [Verrucomicrobiota bacterium]
MRSIDAGRSVLISRIGTPPKTLKSANIQKLAVVYDEDIATVGFAGLAIVGGEGNHPLKCC